MDLLRRPGRAFWPYLRTFRTQHRLNSEDRSSITQSRFNTFVLRTLGKDPKTATVGEVDDARSKFRIIVYSGIMLVTIGISHYYIRVGKKERQEKEAELLKTLEGRKSS